MRYIGTVCAIALAVGCGLTAGELPTIENFDGWNAPPQVNGSAAHLVRRAVQGDALAATPDHALIRELAAEDHVFRWTPLWHRAGAGGIRLAATAVATDQSGLAVVETIGDDAGPNGALLVFFNLYNGQIVNGIWLPRSKVTALAWLPGTAQLLALEAPQPALKLPPRWLRLDPAAPEPVAAAHVLDTALTTLVCDESVPLVWAAGDDRIVQLDPATGAVTAIATGRAPIRLAAIPGGGVYVADAEQLRWFDPAGTELGACAYDNWQPSRLITGGAAAELLMIGTDERVKLFYRDTLSELDAPATAAGWLPQSACYAVAWRYKRQVELMAPDGKALDCRGKLKSGVAAELVALPGPEESFLILDSAGNRQKLTPLKRNFRYAPFGDAS